jgi:hypothetical protein
MNLFRIAVFNQTMMALMFMQCAESAGIDVHIVPAPREYSVSCGLACRFPSEAEADLRKMSEKKGIVVAAYHDDVEK